MRASFPSPPSLIAGFAATRMYRAERALFIVPLPCQQKTFQLLLKYYCIVAVVKKGLYTIDSNDSHIYMVETAENISKTK